MAASIDSLMMPLASTLRRSDPEKTARRIIFSAGICMPVAFDRQVATLLDNDASRLLVKSCKARVEETIPNLMFDPAVELWAPKNSTSNFEFSALTSSREVQTGSWGWTG